MLDYAFERARHMFVYLLVSFRTLLRPIFIDTSSVLSILRTSSPASGPRRVCRWEYILRFVSAPSASISPWTHNAERCVYPPSTASDRLLTSRVPTLHPSTIIVASSAFGCSIQPPRHFQSRLLSGASISTPTSASMLDHQCVQYRRERLGL